MKTKTTPKSAFTLVEMLVVITIISLVAMAVSRAVKGAKRTANAAKCQANLKNLHTAVSTYLADKGYYPLASSYETMKQAPDNGKVIKLHSEHVGWVSWVPKSKNKKRRTNSGKTPWDEKKDKSHADDFYYPANSDQKMREAIEEGSLYKYAGKDPASYKCPERKGIYLSYAMNSWFYSHSWLYVNWEHRVDGHPVDGHRNTHDDFTSKTSCIPSRMGLFIEMEDADETDPEKRKGQSDDDKQHAKILKGDCVWEWWEKVGLEKGMFSHHKAAANYCHVVFVDGHVAAIPEKVEVPEDWNNHKNIDEVFKTLGAGNY